MEADYLRGLIDLNVSAVKLDPTSQTMLLTIVGQPYGNIVFTGNRDLLALGFPSSSDSNLTSIDTTTPVQSCALPVQAWGCADLNLVIGSQILSYSTGDAIERRTIAIDVRPDDPLDNYPFDTYTATGMVKVGMTVDVSHIDMHCQHHSGLQLCWLAGPSPGLAFACITCKCTCMSLMAVVYATHVTSMV